MLIVSIDVGIVHLGIVWASVEEHWELVEFEGCELVNLMDIVEIYHKNVHACPLEHDKTIVDRLRHFQALYFELLDHARVLFIERQPIQGHTVVEQLLFDWYRHKAVLIHPSTMHKRFGFRILDYEQRKAAACQLLLRQPRSVSFQQQFQRIASTGEARVHDLADAACILLAGIGAAGDIQKKKVVREHVRSVNHALAPQLAACGDDIQKFFLSFQFDPQQKPSSQVEVEEEAEV